MLQKCTARVPDDAIPGGSGNLTVHSSVPGGYRCFLFAVSQYSLSDRDCENRKLTARDRTNAHRVQPVMQTGIPGVKSPKMGIGLGHRQIPDTRQNDMESKFHD